MKERLIGILNAGGWLSAVTWRLGFQPLPRTRAEEIGFADTDSRRLTLGFASDFHAGPTTRREVLAETFRLLGEASCDLILLGGDYVHARDCHAEQVAEGLADIDCSLGKFAVLGNHDLWTNEARIRQTFERSGIPVLCNEVVSLPAPFEDIQIIGLDDPRAGSPTLPPGLAKGTLPPIVLMHSPDGVFALGDQPCLAAFCGHTHGGQVSLPGGRPMLVPRGKLSRRYCFGRFDLKTGPLIVTRGVGNGVLPIRWNADPEVVICTIHLPKKADSVPS